MQIILNLKEEMTEEQIEQLPQLFRDAFGEFSRHREYISEDCERVHAYVNRRYSTWDDSRKEKKEQEVRERCKVARMIRGAELTVNGEIDSAFFAAPPWSAKE